MKAKGKDKKSGSWEVCRLGVVVTGKNPKLDSPRACAHPRPAAY
jgi:hypothetical protein